MAAVVPDVDEGADLDHEVSDGGKLPRWMASRSMLENQDVVEEARNSWCRCRFLHTPATFPVAISSAANKVVVPCRT
jgi:hypothetical protein